MKKTLIKMLFILCPFIFLTSCGGWQLRGYDASYGDKVMAYINTKDLKDQDYINSHFIVMCTKKGIIKKTRSW